MLASSSYSAQENASATSSRGQRFTDQVVIVTGASRGIGRGIANLFADEGAKVMLVGRDEERLKGVQAAIQKKGKKAFYIQADVSNPKDMESMVQDTLKHYGKVDVLCHNAGIYPHARLENMTLEEWQKVINVNLTGTFLAVKACLPCMKAQGCGKIVITSSISGPRTALPGYSHYTASKGGIAGFVKTAAVELAKYRININAVEPGNIMTEGLENLGEEHIQNMIRAIPLGRLGTPEDVAHAILFLASKEADYITGQSLIIDGGQTLPESHFSDY
ncbi:SDR family oxidoreductase [Candidatus Protochlamydia phocaeensis]|uniref:SDR family oxidoreductase n=1 Tax=Candidatus Protochlamydia phocaeensis TaxID=1414722 RepID=UPI0009AD1AFD|nr:SDR family oxidoreductase [Candidatus Protochlamydia phocaeensis]